MIKDGVNYIKYFIGITIFFLFATIVNASTGIIDNSVIDQAKVCHDVSCTTPTPGIINFKLVSEPSITIDSVTGLSGKVWGNELGWITMNPTGSGVIFTDPTTGLLTGKAWSQVSGWINFAVTGQSVTINPSTGEFAGWAWAGGLYGGWIKFDCSDSGACVKTTWRGISSGGGGGHGHPIDVCPNIPETQSTIPAGYTVDQDGNCVLAPIDVCPNLEGDQTTVPDGFMKNSVGACIPNFIDYCPNIAGVQSSIPLGYIVDSSGNCIKIPKDFCPDIPGIQTSYNQCNSIDKDLCTNLPGIQISVPDNYINNNGICLPNTFDICPNINGVQSYIPNGYIVDVKGSCVPQEKDVCSNLSGIQAQPPKGFQIQGVNCIYVGTLQEENIRVIALRIIPKSIQIPVNTLFLKRVLEKTDKLLGIRLPVEPYEIDLVSSWVLGLLLILLLLAIIKIISAYRRNSNL